MRRMLVSAVVVTMLSVITPARADHSWSTFHWARSSNPFTLTVVDSLTGDWDPLLASVVSDWTSSSVIDLTVEGGDTSLRSRKKCAPISGKVRACNASYGYNGWLGVASVWLSGDHIVKATTKVNDSYFALSTYDNAYARQHVLCQEIGHDFGLDHQYSEPSCMDDKQGLSDPAYVSPGAHDFEHLETIYNAHLDSGSNTSGGTKGNGKGHGHGHGRASVVRSIDGGLTLLEFVVWAE